MARHGEAQDRNQVLREASADLHRARHGNHVFRQGTPDCAKLLINGTGESERGRATKRYGAAFTTIRSRKRAPAQCSLDELSPSHGARILMNRLAYKRQSTANSDPNVAIQSNLVPHLSRLLMLECLISSRPFLSRDGGTGRRSGLKIRRASALGGSTPPPGTN